MVFLISALQLLARFLFSLSINIVIVYITVTDQGDQDAEEILALASPRMVFIATLYLLIGASCFTTSPINYPDFAF